MSNDLPRPGGIRFYFSFRSPYAWLAAERLESELLGLGVPLELMPIFPRPGHFPNDPSALPEKQAYLVQDIARLARERGLTLRFPEATDTDWALSHGAMLALRDRPEAPRFVVELFRKRFGEGLDLGLDEVVADAARHAGIDPQAALEAGHSDAIRSEADGEWDRAVSRDGIFGVPSFLFAGRLYWGQDRIHFLKSAVERKTALA